MRTKTIFCGSEKSDHDSELTAFVNRDDELFIRISTPDDVMRDNFICLDKLTAIALLKHLKKQINDMCDG